MSIKTLEDHTCSGGLTMDPRARPGEIIKVTPEDGPLKGGTFECEVHIDAPPATGWLDLCRALKSSSVGGNGFSSETYMSDLPATRDPASPIESMTHNPDNTVTVTLKPGWVYRVTAEDDETVTLTLVEVAR